MLNDLHFKEDHKNNGMHLFEYCDHRLQFHMGRQLYKMS